MMLATLHKTNSKNAPENARQRETKKTTALGGANKLLDVRAVFWEGNIFGVLNWAVLSDEQMSNG